MALALPANNGVDALPAHGDARTPELEQVDRDGVHAYTRGLSSQAATNARNRRQLSIAVLTNSDSGSYAVEEGGETATTARLIASSLDLAERMSSAHADDAVAFDTQLQERRAAMESLEGRRPATDQRQDHHRIDSGNSPSPVDANRLSTSTNATSNQRSSLASTGTAVTSEPCHGHAIPASSLEPLEEQEALVHTSPSVEVTSPRSPPYQSGTYETRASGAIAGGWQPGRSQNSAREDQPSRSTLASSVSAGPNRRSFFSNLLSRSASLNNGHSHSHSLSARGVSSQGLAAPSARAFPHNSASGRASTSSTPSGPSDSRQSRRRTLSNALSPNGHARHSSNPVPPSPTMLGRSTTASPVPVSRSPSRQQQVSLSSPVQVPAAHDGVFGRQPLTQDGIPSLSELERNFTRTSSTVTASASGGATTPSSRASRILRQFSGPAERPSSDRERGRSPAPPIVSATSKKPAELSSMKVDAKGPPSLESIGLSLNPLSPSMPVSKHGQPLCGAVLDEKYLLIGTTVGLDFLPLNRAGNRPLRSGIFSKFSSSTSTSPVVGLGMSSSSSNPFLAGEPSSPREYSKDIRTRKPIPLIKKTRFKQLAVLGERSNVLLAVAGRNDHVRVYALDSLRAIIDKKMREIDEKERGSPALSTSLTSPGGSAGLGFGSPAKGLGMFLPGSSTGAAGQKVPPVPPIPGSYKGKERAMPSPAIAASSPAQSSSSRLPSSATMSSIASTSSAGAGSTATSEPPQRSPPPDYTFPSTSPTASRPQSPTSPRFTRHPKSHGSASTTSPGRRRASASGSSGPPTPRNARMRSRSNAQVPPLPSPPASAGAMRRYKSRDSLRTRPSSSGHGASSTHGTFSRRGSAATVTPGTVAALAAADLGITAPRRRSAVSSKGGEGRSRRSSAVANTAGGEEMAEEDFEWVDAPGSPMEPVASQVPEADLIFEEHPVALKGSLNSSTGGRLEARAATIAPAVPEEAEPSVVGSDNDSGRTSRRIPRRLSLAQILREDPEEEILPLSARAPAPVMARSASSGVLSTRSTSTLRSTNSIGQPRSAVARSPREDFASLAEFLRAGPPSPAAPPLVRSTSVGLLSDAQLTERRAKGKMPLIARSAIVPRASADESEDSGPSLIDILRAGPPGSVPMLATSSSSSGGEEAGRPSLPRNLSKSKPPSLHRRPSQLTESAATIPQESAVSPRMTRSPIMLQDEVANQIATVDADVAEQEAQMAPKRSSRSTASSPLRERTTSVRSSDAAQASRGRTASDNLLPTDGSLQAAVSATMQKRLSYQPRSPTFTRVQHSAATHSTATIANGMSLQEMLAAEPPSPVPAAPEIASMSRTDTRDSNVSSSTATAMGDPMTPGAARNKRKRWSLLEGLRAPSPISPQASSSAAMQTSRSTVNASVSSSSLASSASRASSSELSHVPEHTVAPPVATDQRRGSLNNAPPTIPLLKARPGNPLEDESPPFGNLTPEVDNSSAMAAAAAQGANNPDGTTVTFTQSRTVISGPNGPPSDVERNVHGRTPAQQAALTGNLEYVKLARTKGARFIRATETTKRTYLAVLCGEQGERIELFTGSKNVSLSLNRTFVLPETPRTIEFQLQGEDLLDLYLIYDSAIFALEPSTVRVREVGIHRNERRAARRERERSDREAATFESSTAGAQPPGTSSQPSASASSSDTEAAVGAVPLDPEGAAMQTQSEQDELPPPPLTPLGANMPVPVPSMSEDSAERVHSHEPASADMLREPSSEGEATRPARSRQATNDAPHAREGSQRVAGTDQSAAASGDVVPYTTFQQLEYLPPVPPSVLSSSYIIPPTYETVLSASPAPPQGEGLLGLASSSETSRTPSPSANQKPGTHSLDSTPLLSPVSLLSNPSAKTTGPPGLFFVSKGRNTTGIVDGDGRSVIKQPISWNTSDYMPCAAEQAAGLETFTRLDVLLTADKTRVCLAAFGPSSARVIELGGPYQESAEVVPPEAYKRRLKSAAAAIGGRDLLPDEVFIRDVTYLAKSGEATYFAERVGSGIMIHALAATGFAVPP